MGSTSDMAKLKGARVVVTGHAGFLGHHVMEALHAAGALTAGASRRTGVNLLRDGELSEFVQSKRPDTIVHLAATVGGIGANMEKPGTFFRENMLMGMNVVQACAAYDLPLLFVSTICAYPKMCPPPFREEDYWTGFPEETNAPYGIAKKALQVMCSAYRKEFGLKYLCLVPTNLMGPYDNFDERTSHVIPAMIRRFISAKEKGLETVRCWGTGTATRSFLYVEDAADAIVKGTEVLLDGLDFDGIVNLPGCPETSMRRLAEIIAATVGYTGVVGWDHTKPDGQPRRAVSGDRAKALLGWEPSTSLGDGIARTVEWHMSPKEAR